MPIYEISIHLAGGSSATIKEEAQSIAIIEQLIKRELATPDPELRIQAPRSLISVKRELVVGYSIDEV